MATGTKKLNIKTVMAAAKRNDGTGFCKSCGTKHRMVEPDARGYTCTNCGKAAVYGAEELAMMLLMF